MADSDIDLEDIWGEEPDWLKDSAPKKEEDDEDEWVSSSADHLLILLDYAFKDEALPICYELVRQCIRQSACLGIGKRDGLGIFFFNTPDGHEVVPLEPSGKEAAQALQQDFDYSMNDNSLTDALFEAPSKFSMAKCVNNIDYKTTWLVTPQTKPNDQRWQTACEDTLQADIELKVIHSIEELREEAEIRRRLRRARRSASLPLILLPKQEHHIQLDWYYTCRVGVKPSSKQYTVHNETGRKLDRLYQYICEDDLLMQTQGIGHDKKITGDGADRTRHVVPFADEVVEISYAERDEIRLGCNTIQDSGYVLVLGFHSLESLPFWHNMERSYFGIPNDDHTICSSDGFQHLHRSMLNKHVWAVAERVIRQPQQSRLVALVPLEEHLTEDKAVIRPAGFLMRNLPYQDECRVVEPNSATPTDDLHVAAMNLVESMKISATIGENFPNEPLLEYWQYVEQSALQDFETPAKVQSELQADPRLAEIPEIAAFVAALPEDAMPASTGKRKGPLDLRTAWETQSLSSCTVQVLKDALADRGLKKTGNKTALVERLTPMLDEEFGQSIKGEPGFIKLEQSDIKVEGIKEESGMI